MGLSLVGAAARLYEVVHETVYSYTARVDLSHHQAYLMPLQSRRQQPAEVRIDIVPRPSHRVTVLDVYGNARTFFSLYVPHDLLSVRAVSQVQVLAPPLVHAARSPAWESVRQQGAYVAGGHYQPATEFVFASPFVPLHAELREWARADFTPGRPLLEAAIALMHRTHREFDYAPAATEVSTPVLEAFTRREGVCQDYAHAMIGALRALGLPARYVSGYLLTAPPAGGERLVGADASHAWLQLHCPMHGWVDLDPTNDLLPGQSHVALAIGRDYGDVMPLRGVVRGGGAHRLDVAVSVTPVENITFDI